MADDTYTSNRRLNSGASEFNAISFLVENLVKGLINTAIPVRVDACTVNSTAGSMQPAGYVSVTPLVQQRGADGKSLQPVSIPQLPYYRYRAGKAALVMDPQPGDVGIAVFCQQDISGLQQEGTDPVPAGSFRAFDQSDGVYLGGILGPSPETWIYIAPAEKKIEISAPQQVIVKSREADIQMEARTKIELKAPQLVFNGPITANDASGGGAGSMTVNGSMTATGDVKSQTLLAAPEIKGHLTGNVNGLCSGAH